MPKVKNVGEREYVGGELYAQPGEVIEVSAAEAAYLLSADCPSKFEAVEEKKADKAGK